MAEITCTSPGASPRTASTRATRSSLRMWLLLTCSICTPAASQTCLRALADALAQRLGKARVIEDADAARVQKARHPARVARAGQRARHDDAVVARQHAVQVRRVPSVSAVAAMVDHLAVGSTVIVLPVWFRLCRLRMVHVVPAGSAKPFWRRDCRSQGCEALRPARTRLCRFDCEAHCRRPKAAEDSQWSNQVTAANGQHKAQRTH